MSSAADPWAAAAQQYKAGGGSAASAPTEPDWKIWTQGNAPEPPKSDQPEQGFGSYARQVGQNIWGAIKGTGQLISDVGSMGTDPMAGQRLYENVVQPQIQQFQKAGQAWRGEGEFSGVPEIDRKRAALGYGLAGALPGVGPMAARAGEQLGAGDPTGAAATGTTMAAMRYAPEAIGDIAGAAAGRISRFRTPNPDTTFYQALPWRHEIPDYQEMAPTLRGDIKRAAQQSQGAPPSTTGVGGGWQPITPRTPAQLSGEAPLNDIPSVLKGTQAAKAENRAIVDLHVDPYRQSGWTGNGAPIADEIINAIPATLRARAQAGIPEAVAEVNRIVQEANVYRRQFTPDEIFGLNREFNAGLNNFFHKTSDAQHALIGKGGDTATLEAAARGTRNLIRQSFGDDVANLQRRWGWLDDAEAGLRAQWKKVMKSPEETPASELDAAMLKAGIPGKLTHGDITGAKYAFRGGKTDSLLQDTFNNTEPGWPLPTPQPSGMPGVGGMPRAQGPARQLPPATPQIQPRSGGYVSSTGMPPGPQQNIWQGIGAPRQLPAGSPTQGQGVIQVPPAGAANPYTGPRPNLSPELTQIPPSPRTAAAPTDTSGVSYYGPNPLVGSTSFVRKGPSPFGSERGSFSNRASVEPETTPTGDSLVERMSKQIWNTLNPTKIGDPNTFSRIQARDVLHHSTNLDAGESILQEGAIIPKRYTDKFLGWGTETQPDIAGRRAGFTGPRTSLSRAQRVDDPITFEVDPSYVKNPRPIEALRKSIGKSEFETGTQEPIPAEGIKNVLINTNRVQDMYGDDAAGRISRIEALAAQRGIPVIKGTTSELMSRRPLGMQGPMRPVGGTPLAGISSF